MTLRYGILGTGMMGQEHIRNIALLDDAETVAFVETDEGMAAGARGLLPAARRCASLDEMLPGIDALVVATPNDLHAAQLAEVAARRPLPILMEKPLYTDPADADAVARLAEGYPAPIWVAMEYRYMPPVAAFLGRVGGATGGIRMLSVREHRFPFLDKVGRWNRSNARSGGTLVEKCCHFFDLMRLILRDDPVRVMASAGQDVNRLGEADVWDNAYVIVDFRGGARAMLELCMFAEGSKFQERLAAFGPKGMLEAKVVGPGRFWPERLGKPPVPVLTESPREPRGPVKRKVPVPEDLLEAGDHNGATFYQHQRFARAALGKGPVEVTARDGAWAVRMGHAAQESARTGRAVVL
ncbi:putative dehydrogenase [Hasllibacter halocynthiae]|uniref:Putative dehydrogenase n=1 Tax=Hasllibacter halocynthiae TaxID=595589 RepID=A0A2T0X922_9RHOB|nr:Gfo/Idh/MocA family oxidoreductase [Hasllibacter halocynthiae]PRY95451.1 putative dehydrogenase [Hasllibacter halocynthiae]